MQSRWGLGGAGKSQLVLSYIREYRQDYPAVFWIEGVNQARLYPNLLFNDIRYALVERSRTAKAFFDPPNTEDSGEGK